MLYKGISQSYSLHSSNLWVLLMPFIECLTSSSLPSKNNYLSFCCIYWLSSYLVPGSFLLCGEGTTLVLSIWVPLNGHRQLAKIAQEQMTDILIA